MHEIEISDKKMINYYALCKNLLWLLVSTYFIFIIFYLSPYFSQFLWFYATRFIICSIFIPLGIKKLYHIIVSLITYLPNIKLLKLHYTFGITTIMGTILILTFIF